MLLNRREIIESFDDFVIHHKNENNKDAYSTTKRKVLLSLCGKFYQLLIQKYIPNLTEDWLYYKYSVIEDSIKLTLYKCEEIEFNENNEVESLVSDEEYTLIEVKCDYLTVEQYAILHEVTDTTVRQWIRRGKLRTAKKEGNSWLIPTLADKPTRGFESATYC